MAFADPQTISFDGDTFTLARVLDDGLKSIYQNETGTMVLTISHQVRGSRINRMARLDHQFQKADINAENTLQTVSVWMALDEPNNPGLRDGEILEFLFISLSEWARKVVSGSPTYGPISQLKGSQH